MDNKTPQARIAHCVLGRPPKNREDILQVAVQRPPLKVRCCLDDRHASIELYLAEFIRITEAFDSFILFLFADFRDMTPFPIYLPHGTEQVARECIQTALAGDDPRNISPEHKLFCEENEIHPAAKDELDTDLAWIANSPPELDECDDAPIYEMAFGDSGYLPCRAHEPVDISQTTTLQHGRLMRRRAATKDTVYYYCTSPGCKGSIAVDASGTVREVKPHVCAAPNMGITSWDWDELNRELASRLSGTSGGSGFRVLREMAEEREKWTAMIYNARHCELVRMLQSVSHEKESVAESPFDLCPASSDFLLYHSVTPRPLIIMATSFMVEESEKVSWILIDGTFKACPKQFTQLVTFLGEDIDTGMFTPLVYMLLEDKTRESYRYALAILRTIMHFPKAQMISCDYEEGLRQEVEQWIIMEQMKCKFFGCKFHFSQCLYRKLQKCSDPKIRRELYNIFQLFSGFVYLTKKEIDECLDKIEEREHPFGKFVEYFKSYWMPRYNTWNLSGVDDYMYTRCTNNAIESFNALVGDALPRHPKMERFVTTMKRISLTKQRELDLGFERAIKEATRPEPREIIWRFDRWVKQWTLKV